MKKLDVTQVPFNSYIGLKFSDAPNLLSVKAEDFHMNHVGTISASVCMTLAEVSSGEFLLRNLNLDGKTPVIRNFHCKFKKPALNKIFAQCNASAELIEKWQVDLDKKGRALIEVPIEIVDELGAILVTAKVEWFIC